MRRANFIVGFSNWGKSHLINNLFGKTVFHNNREHYLVNLNIKKGFIVHPQSNDDLGKDYIIQIDRRLSLYNQTKLDLFSTICPATELRFNWLDILQDPRLNSFKECNMFLLKHKWDHHAELRTEEVKASLHSLKRVNFYTIDEGKNLDLELRLSAKLEQVKRNLEAIYNN